MSEALDHMKWKILLQGGQGNSGQGSSDSAKYILVITGTSSHMLPWKTPVK